MTMVSLLVDEYYAQEKKEVILKIKKKCSTIKDISILEDDFVLKVIQFIVINPIDGFLKVDQESLGRLIDLSSAFILDENSPLITSLKMSKQFRKMFKQKDWNPEEVCSISMSKHNSEVDFFLDPMLNGIISVSYTNDKHIVNILYDRIVLYIILKSGLGTPEKSSVVKATQTALSSVFQVYSVKPFLKKSEEEKKEQLKQLTSIVTGIRLFYWHYGDHGDDIENIPDALVRGLNKSVQDLLSRKVDIENKVKKYADVLRKHFTFPICLRNGDKRSPKDNDEEHLINNFKPNEKDAVRSMKVTINLLHQYMQQLDEIHSFMKFAHHDVRKTMDELHAAFVDLQKLTKHKNKYVLTDCVPTDTVVVKFNNVASLWKRMWTHLVSVHDLNDLEEKLHQTFNEARLASNEFIMFSEDTLEEPSDCDKSNINENEIVKINYLCKLVEYQSDICLRFRDFSSLFLILEGFFVPANTELGVIQYNNENYAFSSLEEMYLFCKNPDKHLSKMSNTLRYHPELLDTFQIKEQTILPTTEDTRKCETGIQTELHPVKRLIDKNYHYNAYELMRRHRKKTEAYLNCEDKATKTCLLEDVSTQTQDQRSVIIQGNDKATCSSLPRPFRYIHGLRGFDNDESIQDTYFLPLINNLNIQ